MCRIKLASSAEPQGDLAHGETLLQGVWVPWALTQGVFVTRHPRPRRGWVTCVSPETRGHPECLLQEAARHMRKTVGSPTTDGRGRNTGHVLTPTTDFNQKVCDFLWLPEPVTTAGGLKTTDIHPAPVPGTRRLRSGCPRAELPAEAPGEGPPRFFQLLGAPGVHPWAGGRLPPVSASVSTWLLCCVRVSSVLCLIRTLSLGFRATPIQEEPHLRPFTPSHLQRPRFLMRSCSQVLGLARRRAICSAVVQALQGLFKGC